MKMRFGINLYQTWGKRISCNSIIWIIREANKCLQFASKRHLSTAASRKWRFLARMCRLLAVVCSAPRNNSGKPGVTLHTFPLKRPDILKAWIQNLSRLDPAIGKLWQPNENSRIWSCMLAALRARVTTSASSQGHSEAGIGWNHNYFSTQKQRK